MNNCLFCKQAIVPIADKDWESRKYHKKCWKMLVKYDFNLDWAFGHFQEGYDNTIFECSDCKVSLRQYLLDCNGGRCMGCSVINYSRKKRYWD